MKFENQLEKFLAISISTVFVISTLGLLGVSVASFFVDDYKTIVNLLLFFVTTFSASYILGLVFLK